MTTIKKCVCEHEFQDKRYGKGYRVHNQVTKELPDLKWRCTVCKRES